jgi:hypothetical protein
MHRCMYGGAINNPFVFAGNIVGISCSIFYILSTYGLADSATRTRIERIMLPLAFIETIIAFLYTLLGHRIGAVMLGYLANAVVLLVFGSPLTAAAKVHAHALMMLTLMLSRSRSCSRSR